MHTAPRYWLVPPLLLGLLGCSGSEVSAGDKDLPEGPARRVILITCDTLRADHLSCYGYDRPTSPRLDGLAKESVLFTNAWAVAPRTMPSVSSMLAGRLPDAIGATPGNQDLMPAEVVTLAEVARDAGFDTAAIVSNSVLAKVPPEQGDIGVQQGFAYFDDTMKESATSESLHERSAAPTTDAALKWLNGRKADEDRFFLWVHYMDPHGPYTPAPEHLAPFVRDHRNEADLPVATEFGVSGAIPAYQVVGEERKPGQYIDRYDAEIHQFDAELGRLLDGLRAKGWLDDSLLVFTSDHGESLGESERWFSHGTSLQRELLHAPLIMRPPNSLRAELIPEAGGRRNGKLVMHLDLWPTILESLGVRGHPNQGLSLLRSKLPDGRVAPGFFGRLDWVRRVVSVTDGRWHLVATGPYLPALYDMLADPRETKDLASESPEIVARLQARYDAFMREGDGARLAGPKRRMDAESRRNLGALGYTEAEDP